MPANSDFVGPDVADLARYGVETTRDPDEPWSISAWFNCGDTARVSVSWDRIAAYVAVREWRTGVLTLRIYREHARSLIISLEGGVFEARAKFRSQDSAGELVARISDYLTVDDSVIESYADHR